MRHVILAAAAVASVVLAAALTPRTARAGEADQDKREITQLVETTYARIKDAPPVELKELFHFERDEDRDRIVPRVAAALKEWQKLKSADGEKQQAEQTPAVLDYLGLPLRPPSDVDSLDASGDTGRAMWVSDDLEGCSFRKVDGKWLWDGDAQFGIEDRKAGKAFAEFASLVRDAVRAARDGAADEPKAQAMSPALAVDHHFCMAAMSAHLSDVGDKPAPPLVKNEDRLASGLGRVTCVAVSPDGKRAVSGGASVMTPLREWDLEARKPARVFRPVNDALVDVHRVAYTPDGSKLIAAGVAWSVGSVVRAMRGGGLDEKPYESLDADHVVWIFDFESGREVLRLTPPRELVETLAVSPDGSALAVCGPYSVSVWDTRTGEPRYEKAKGEGGGQAVAFADNDTLLIQRLSDAIAVIDLKTGSELRSFKLDDEGAKRPTTCLAVNPAGTTVAVATMNGVTTYKIATGRQLRHYKLRMLRGGMVSRVNDVRFSKDGTRLLACCGLFIQDDGPLDGLSALMFPGDPLRIVRVWDTTNGLVLDEREGHVKAVSGVAWLGDERQVLSSSTDGTLRLWTLSR